MQQVAGFPYFEVQFNRDGQVHDRAQADALLNVLDQGDVTDLFVLAHGWNNDMADARGLYANYLGRMRELFDAGHGQGVEGRSSAVLGVLWPSKKFADQELIPSGAASAGSAVSDAVLRAQLDGLKGVFSGADADAKLERAKALVPKLEDSTTARREFADLLRSVVPRDAADAEDASDRFFRRDGAELMDRLSQPTLAAGSAGPGGGAQSMGGASGGVGGADRAATGAPGGAVGFELSLAGTRAAARRLLNYVTYYQMKERAGVVGRDGVNGVLREVRARRPDIRIHLVGHSFGGRVATAAAVGPEDQPPVGIATMTLLQAAFSHNGFAERYDQVNDGFFRRLVTDRMVSGPVVISYTANDTAVGQLYPIASKIAGQAASALGDKNDLYGGIGRNGAQRTPEAVDGSLLDVGGAYALEGGKLYNLQADAFIKDHGDVTGGQIVHAMLAAVATT